MFKARVATRIGRLGAPILTHSKRVTLAGFWIFFSATTLASAGTFVVFGPKDYLRSAGPPDKFTDSFAIPSSNTSYTLSITNSGVASAVVSINGTDVFGPSDFNPTTTSLS